jgi:hypothetical protein
VKSNKSLQATMAFVIALMGATVNADENGPNIVYLGVGAAKSGTSYDSNKAPISIGYLNIANPSGTVWGGDISGEGTMLDSTWGQNKAVNQATSFNFIFGKNISKTEDYRFDGSLLIGIREKTSDCPKSYLGYQCYAASTPSTSYGVNYGLVLALTYKQIMLGVLATGESTQGLLGLRF